MPERIRTELLDEGSVTPPFGGAPIQFVDVFPRTSDRKIHLAPDIPVASVHGLYGYQPDPATDRFPLALISPATEKTVSSTMGELRQRPAVLHIHPADAAQRGIEQDDAVRIFNALGEVQAPANLTADMRRGTVAMSKGLWRKSTYNGFTSNALVPDALTDLGGGACFNDARVEVALIARQ
jgi:anaerobic selenocysteine-containing dehydrogenase